VQEEVKNDPKYKDQLIINPSSDIFYITFDVTKPPFNDIRVRQAFALALNRETICNDVLKGTCAANYSFLPVGFPGWQGEKMKSIQAYDAAKAKQLMADAGYPDGKGFPEMTFYIRGDTPVPGEAVVAMWQETLGVKLSIESFDRTNFMQKMLAHQFQIYQLAYGADFPDPVNLLSLWLCSTKRHEWCNANYDELITKSATQTDAAVRGQTLFDAEKILLEDFGVIPVYSQIAYTLYKPWFHTKIVDDKRAGAKAWPGYNFFHLANQYYTVDTPKNWPPVDASYLK
jgi:ABC-type oligopeptide transport system substrate-binding subunit